MFLSALSPDPSRVVYENVMVSPKQITINAVAIAPEAECPNCQQASGRIHSTYYRSPQDLPCMGRAVRLFMKVRRFWCLWPSCTQRIFSERLGEVIASHSRKTGRLVETLGRVVSSLGGEAGSRLSDHLNMQSSSSTLLCVIHALPMPDFDTPRVLGVDDWAIRKGQTYATVLVDLEKGEIIDLLPDRKSETFATWLREHPGVEIISRDRGGAYAKGGRDGAPEAEQVADRWHLVHNLGEALERLMHSHQGEMRAAAEKVNKDKALPSPREVILPEPSKLNKEQLLSNQRYEARKAKYDKVRKLEEEGHSISSIARNMGMVPRTVKKYLREGEPRLRRSRRTPSTVEPYHRYLRQRWEEGCHNARQLWNELQEQGFEGSRAAVKRYVKPWRGLLPKAIPSPAQLKLETMTARQAIWLLLRTKRPLSDNKKAFRAALFEASPILEKVAEHVEQFQDMLAGLSQKTLPLWMEEASNLGPELSSFVHGLKMDQQAVENAISMPWSQGPVEGMVNRIKTIKRQMYGRAGLELLRRRLILDG